MSKFSELRVARRNNNPYELQSDNFVSMDSEPLSHQKISEPPKRPHGVRAPPKSVRLIKLFIILIAISLIGYVLITQFVLTKDFNNFYDLGTDGEPLTPPERVIISEDYANLTSSLVYIDTPIPRGSEKITIQSKFQDNLPKSPDLRIGVRDQEVWSYSYKPVYNPLLNNLSKYNSNGSVYRINPSLEVKSIEELKEMKGITIATDENYETEQVKLEDYSNKETVIDTALRGEHVFYIYTKDSLTVKVKKQDINWYEGDDVVDVALYTLDNKLLANISIPDDGVLGIDKKKNSVQEGTLNIDSLDEGAYKLKISDADAIIKEIKVNTNKIVAERLFLAGNAVYNTPTKPSKIYTYIEHNNQVRLLTYHPAGLQDVEYSKTKFSFNKEDVPMYLNLPEGSSMLTFPKNDIIVSGQYFAFSQDGYFEPYVQKVVSLGNDLSWVDNNVDYIISSYKPPVKDGNWTIGQVEFDVKELYIKDGKLSVVFHAPHLGQEEFTNYTIPVDWINITVHKPGVFSK